MIKWQIQAPGLHTLNVQFVGFPSAAWRVLEGGWEKVAGKASGSIHLTLVDWWCFFVWYLNTSLHASNKPFIQILVRSNSPTPKKVQAATSRISSCEHTRNEGSSTSLQRPPASSRNRGFCFVEGRFFQTINSSETRKARCRLFALES